MAASDGEASGAALHAHITAFFDAQLPARLEVEILPSSFPLPANRAGGLPILSDGPSLAIRRADLVRAYVHARAIFFAANASVPDSERSAAAVTLLLLHPEHLTAANHRKRALLAARQRARDGDAAAQAELQHLLRRELALLASLLTSPLAAHPRSPTLWGHRAWVLRAFREELLGQSGGGLEAFEVELDVVLGAAERHGSNYYAWMHARRALELFVPEERRGELGRGDEGAGGRRNALQQAARTVRAWCLAHPGDVSGWTFLAHLLELAEDAELVEELRAAVVRFVEDIQWKGESVRRFLDATSNAKRRRSTIPPESDLT